MERSAVEGDLRYWGPRYARILLSSGFSGFNIFADLLSINDQPKGHRVLIPDMTPRAWKVNQRVWSLPVEYSWALVARYALPPRDDTGQLYSAAEIAMALGWKPDQYRQRVVRARKKYQALLFG